MVNDNWQNDPRAVNAVNEAQAIVMGCMSRRSSNSRNRRVEIIDVRQNGAFYSVVGRGTYLSESSSPRTVDFICKLEHRIDALGQDYFIEKGWEATEP